MKKNILISIAAYIIVMATISVNATTDYFSDAEYLCGFIDKQGNVLGEIKFDEVKAFGKDLAPVSVDGKWGLMNKLGELVMPLEYLDAYSSDTGGGVVWTGAEWIYVDKDGKVVLKSSMKYPEFIDWESKIVNAPEPEEETELSGYYCGYGIYFVSENNQYGFVNAKGEKLSDLDYEYPGERPIRFGDGLLSVRKNGLIGYVDTNLKLVIDYQFSNGDEFCDGMAQVFKDGKIGYINTKGELVIDYIWDFGDRLYTFGHFFNGFAAVMKLSKPVTPPSEWAQTEINEAIKLDLIPSHLQSFYQNNITRNDLTVTLGGVLTEVCGKDLDEFSKTYSPDYIRPDFSGGSNAYTVSLNRLGILNGRDDGTFGMDELLTREELAALLYRAMNIFNKNAVSESTGELYLDDSKLSDWSKKLVYALAQNGILFGTPDGNFAPSGMVTREQAYLAIYRMYRFILS